jgi:hypothetical protein
VQRKCQGVSVRQLTKLLFYGAWFARSAQGLRTVMRAAQILREESERAGLALRLLSVCSMPMLDEYVFIPEH